MEPAGRFRTRAAKQNGNAIIVKITAGIPGYHTAPVEAAGLARDAGARHLLIDHIVQQLVFAGMDSL